MASASDSESRPRPLLRVLAAGRKCLYKPVTAARGYVRRRRISAPFASISSESQDVGRGSDEHINYSIFAPEETSSESRDGRSLQAGVQDTNPRFSSLVQQESEPLYTVTFPAWMVEVYKDVTAFGRAARRLFLPENSIKSKLPYYKEAVTNPGTWVKLDGKFEHLTQQYRKYGQAGHFVSSSKVNRERGKRFDMPSPGMKTIAAAEIFMTWFLTTVYV